MRKGVDILIISTSFSPTKSYCQSSARFSQVFGTLITCLYLILYEYSFLCWKKPAGFFPLDAVRLHSLKVGSWERVICGA